MRIVGRFVALPVLGAAGVEMLIDPQDISYIKGFEGNFSQIFPKENCSWGRFDVRTDEFIRGMFEIYGGAAPTEPTPTVTRQIDV